MTDIPNDRPLVALTGATGFIGRRLAFRLAEAGRPVRVLVRRPGVDLGAAAAETVVGTLEDDEALARLADGAQVVIHAAGAVRGSGRAEFHRANAAATARLAAICASRPRSPRRIFLSSLAARAPDLSDYAASKRAAETALAGMAGRLDWVALRPPVVYGPGDRATLPLFRMMRRGFLPVPAGRERRFSMLHVDDLCAAVEAVLATPQLRGTVIEVCDGTGAGYSWRDLARAAGMHLGRRVVCLPIPRQLLLFAAVANLLQSRVTGAVPLLSPGKVSEFYHIDWVCRDNPLVEAANWRPRVGMAVGIGRTLDWYLAHGWL